MRLPLVTSYLVFMIFGICSADEPDPETTSPRTTVARSDLVYDKPAATPDEGQPIGNGRMGTMVWTSPNAIHLQVNRVDVFAVNANHQGQPGQRGSPTDYCGGIASAVIEVGGQPFAADKGNFRQQLSLETAECILETTDIVARMFVSANTDVLVLELDDRRDAPQPLQIAVSMLRQPEVRVGENFASTGFVDNPKQVVLHQRFRERDFHNASALVVSVSGNDAAENKAAQNKAAQIVPTSATTRTLILPPAHGKRVLLISSAASRQATDDPSARAASLFENAASQSVTELREAHQKWWRDFWSRTFVDLSSDDGQAQRAQRWRDLHLYHMASSSRGELSPRAKGLCQFDSQLNVVKEPYKGRFSWISNVASSGSELAIHAWWRYRYTGDQNWLRTHAYPLLRGTVEFYRHLVRKEADGRYHLSGTHAHEDFWGVRDSIMDLAAIRGTAPLAIRAAEILGVDPDLRDQWKELLENLAPYPMGSDPQAKALTGGALAEDVWAAGYLGEMDGQHNPEDVRLTPVFPLEDWTLETRNVVTDPIVQKLLDLAPRHKSVLGGAGTNTAIRSPIAAVRAGRGDELPAILERYANAFSPLPNGMSLFEGPTAASVEHLGLLTTTLQDALLQSVSARPGEECRVRNPWDGACMVQEVDGSSRVVEGPIIHFPTTSGRMYTIFPGP